MRIQSSEDIGKLIRAARLAQRMSQAALALRLGASRRWVGDIEAGHTTAELGRVLAALHVLGVRLEAAEAGPKTAPKKKPAAKKVLLDRKAVAAKVAARSAAAEGVSAAVGRGMDLERHLARFRRA